METAGMNGGSAGQEAARQALLDMRRYLADEVAPMMAADAARVMLRLPPKYGAAVIRQWLEEQLTSPERTVTVSAYLYHAVKKLYLFSELKLVDATAMNRYLGELSKFVVQLCPAPEQPDLKLRLSRIGESRTKLSAPVRLLNREAGTEEEEELLERALEEREKRRESEPSGKQARPAGASPRLVVLMERMKEVRGNGKKKPDDKETQELVARSVAQAAVEAEDAAQLESSLENLREIAEVPKLDQLFRLLASRLPGWAAQMNDGQGDDEEIQGRILKAMHRIVAMAGSPEEGVERFSEMVYAAIEQMNEGHLAQAVAMLDLAQRLIEEKKVDNDLASILRTRAQSSVSLDALRRFASTPAKHGLLRKVLWFFPAFTPENLLQRLDGEPKREVRKLILTMIEVHGPPCRLLLLDRLEKYLSGELPDENGFYSRNAVFLLRRIARGADDDQPRELKLLAEFCRPARPFMIAKEAVGALANLTIPKAERVLIDRLGAFEKKAIDGTLAYEDEERLEILDRACDALARVGTRQSVRIVLHHVFRDEPQLGDTMSRLRHLSRCNLINDPEQLEKLLDLLKDTLPAKLLGMVVGRKVRDVSHLVRALSGTPDRGVKNLFQEIVERFPGQEFAEQAREALARFRSGPAPETGGAEGLAGDLEVFGLPTLLQSLADSEATGRLIISERNGRERAVVLLSQGKMAGCEIGRLRGLDALCQMFERPQPGTFRFEAAASGDMARESRDAMEMLPALLEAMRRHDEFQQDRAVVPDGASLMTTGVPSSAPAEEADLEFVRKVWLEASQGTAPESCERAATGDAYRVRRLYAHWLQQGALKLRPAA